MSTFEDVEAFVEFGSKYFVCRTAPATLFRSIPSSNPSRTPSKGPYLCKLTLRVWDVRADRVWEDVVLRVHDHLARDIVHGAVVDGVNGTVLAYGQTGVGKSFTMIGDTRNYQHRGIAPRAIAQLYQEVESRIELQYTVRVSYMEIYNDRIYDLLEGQQGGDRTGNGELPPDKAHEQTISTLKLAQRMMRVQNEVVTIVETDPALLLRKYERQIRELKHELVMHDALVERPAVVYDEHTPEQKHQLLQMVRRYIDAPTQEMEDEALRLTSVNEIRELFRQFKLLFWSSGLDSMGGAASGMNGSGSHSGAGNANASTRSGSAGSSASRTQTSAGLAMIFGCTQLTAPTTKNWSVKRNLVRLGSLSVSCLVQQDPLRWTRARAKTIVGSEELPMDLVERVRLVMGSEVQLHRGRQVEPSSRVSLITTRMTAVTMKEDTETRAKNDAFQFYRSAGPGRKLHQSLQDEKDKRFDAKQRVKQVTRRVNAAKAQIDAVRAQLEDKRNQRGTHEAAGNRKTGAKQGAKSELEFSLRSVELLRRRLVREFEDWYNEEGHAEEGHAHALSKTSGAAGFDAFARPAFSKDDKLDDGEKFDQMEVDRVRAQDPDLLAFFQAQKKMPMKRECVA
ncbi:hypothetical protein PF008_g21646 [Phytophthora fragariae]|uniref:Kinesin motor domain-containing protein n=1 Tax=Phytophthora fragariae TaxID=53985 RepID=A0A6G0QWP4_9STRA|nr:hypothetical protein PF008_g21646 [Phytophthora fragariae]